MAEIIDFPARKIINVGEEKPKEPNFFGKMSSLGDVRTRSTLEVELILAQAKDAKIICVDTDDLRSLLLDYIISKLKEGRKYNDSAPLLFAANYISDLLNSFLSSSQDGTFTREIMDNPYYTYWSNKGMPKIAGDASVYSYMFRDFPRGNIDKGIYLNFAHSGYSSWAFDKQFPTGAVTVLESIGGLMKDSDFLKRTGIRIIH